MLVIRASMLVIRASMASTLRMSFSNFSESVTFLEKAVPSGRDVMIGRRGSGKMKDEDKGSSELYTSSE